MNDRNEIIEVYHAGTDIIPSPDCAIGRPNLDFGQGFYVTDIYDQALNFARSRATDRKLPPIINLYHLDKRILNEARYLRFEDYDEKWLDFIAACRSGQDVWKDYDYIEGGVADDRVITTVNLYIQGFIPKERALKNLKYLKPNNQICLLNQNLLNKYLTFTNALNLSENGLL